MSPISSSPAAAALVRRDAPHAAAPDARLRHAARQLEGVFVEQLFKAMRATVPSEGVLDGGSGEELFTALLDQHVAGEAASRWERGLGDALYRQLRKSATPPADTPRQRTEP